MAAVDYLLHESAVGYSVFQVVDRPETIGNRLKEVQAGTEDLATFGKMVKLLSFAPFQGAAQALENANDVSEGIASEYLRSLLEVNLPKAGKKKKIVLGVTDKNLAGSIKSAFPSVECETGDTSEVVQDLLRGIRFHAPKLLKQLQEGDVERAQLGLGHAYSRAKVKFSVQKNDNHIIQAIATLDHLDKAINTFSMRVREWYSWHFPELIKIVSDNHTYARLALFVGDKKTLNDEKLHDIAAIVNDDAEIAQSIIDAAKVSMGQDISETDMENVMAFASRVVSLTGFRKSLFNYLVAKMGIVAPNLAALIGEVVGARLISHAGSLTNLSKYPASTVQILGAEKALFRALKTKGNTPKYGLIYHSSFIGKAGQKNKGRISRFLANKCSIASRIDNFSEAPTTKFGEALKQQVEERLQFYATGQAPTKNEVAMKTAMDAVLADINVDDPTANADEDEEMADATPRAVQKQEKKKKDKEEKEEKKDKKDKKKRRHSEADGEVEDKKEKKKKRKSKGVE
ncbi:pre-rRNA processing nucleolar protein-like protein Sik1 [Xylona heveae TC161]|uniref:Nucleolar protein 56 n=1 Tax=Xylona heveae (strain CBS 132557 / TC161) TaxID=1328760 RepID=A0A165GA34_XYLHT|nr:pre-rRNA processing nucleolar protein-like protein Sik1 [Xylona heveae TC161]KZF21934.1 pre-rRNA processing nucleolar protein-like protein Sik1 [Xylona heveae TC161]